MSIPEILVVGDVEFLFLGAALALGFPKVARRILARRYGADEKSENGEPCDRPDCPRK